MSINKFEDSLRRAITLLRDKLYEYYKIGTETKYLVVEKPISPDLIRKQKESIETVKRMLEILDKNNSTKNPQKG